VLWLLARVLCVLCLRCPCRSPSGRPVLPIHHPVLVHDIRRQDQVLHRLSGHVAPNINRTKAIYHPHFVDGGASVLVTGQGLRKLSLYDVGTGATVSRGALGYDATALASGAGGGLLAAAGGKSDGIALLTPIWERKAAKATGEPGPAPAAAAAFPQELGEHDA
jgi:hypothetical protein